jgi:hypothetical protein
LMCTTGTNSSTSCCLSDPYAGLTFTCFDLNGCYFLLPFTLLFCAPLYAEVSVWCNFMIVPYLWNYWTKYT